MKPFPLAAVLRVAELRRRAARGAVATANDAVSRAQAEECSRRSELESAGLSGGSVVSFLDAARRRALRASALRASEDATVDAEVVRDGALAAWTEAEGRVHALDELRQRHADAVDVERQRAEQRLLDDLSGRRPQ